MLVQQWAWRRALGEPIAEPEQDAGQDAEQDAEVLAERAAIQAEGCLLYTSPSPRDRQKSRMPSSA